MGHFANNIVPWWRKKMKKEEDKEKSPTKNPLRQDLELNLRPHDNDPSILSTKPQRHALFLTNNRFMQWGWIRQTPQEMFTIDLFFFKGLGKKNWSQELFPVLIWWQKVSLLSLATRPPSLCDWVRPCNRFIIVKVLWKWPFYGCVGLFSRHLLSFFLWSSKYKAINALCPF